MTACFFLIDEISQLKSWCEGPVMDNLLHTYRRGLTLLSQDSNFMRELLAAIEILSISNAFHCSR